MPLRFTLRQLEYFVAVGEEGSIARAAEVVNVSSPSISTAISQLEQEFGVQLFVRRHAHGLALSPAGRSFLAQARQVLSEADKMNRLVGEISGWVRGPLDMGCLVTFAQIVLPHLRRGFCSRFPDVEFHQHIRDQGEIFEGLRSARLDIALTYDLGLTDEFEFVPLCALPPYVMLPELHPLANHRSITVQDLAEHPMILLDLPHSGPYFLSFFDEFGLEPRIAERTADLEVTKTLVANGFGFSIANVRPFSELAADGKKLRFIQLDSDRAPIRLGLLIAHGSRNLLLIRALIDHCLESVTPALTPGLRFT